MKIKRLPIRDRDTGLRMVSELRSVYGDELVDNLKIINEISFNVPIIDFKTKEVVNHYSVLDSWYLEFPEEIELKV